MKRILLFLATIAYWSLAVPAYAQTAGGVVVTITDTSVSPSTVTIGVGQSVTWINQGTKVHAVVTDNGITPTFDSGGLDVGQKFTQQFPVVASLPYHSPVNATLIADPSNASNTIVTWEYTGTVVVQASAPAVSTPVPTVVAAAVVTQPAGPCQFVLGFQTLHSLDATDIGDCVENQAYQPNGDAQQHTTKGLLAWRKSDNWTAFTNGYKTWINGPGGLVSRLNTSRFPWEHDTAPAVAPVAAAPVLVVTPAPIVTVAPSPTPTPVPNNTIIMTDTAFSPNSLTVKVGTTVTWLNQGQTVHSVGTDAGANPGWDLGGIGPGQSVSYSFNTAGTFTYHSATEQTTFTDSTGTTYITYPLTGKVIVVT